MFLLRATAAVGRSAPVAVGLGAARPLTMLDHRRILPQLPFDNGRDGGGASTSQRLVPSIPSIRFSLHLPARGLRGLGDRGNNSHQYNRDGADDRYERGSSGWDNGRPPPNDGNRSGAWHIFKTAMKVCGVGLHIQSTACVGACFVWSLTFIAAIV
jgi:hypothetical protein